MSNEYFCCASAAFGLEGLVSEELKNAGFQGVSAENGSVSFQADGKDLFRSNLLMHYSDRIYILLASGECSSFSELFDLTASVDWPFYFSGDESIDVSCRCVRSKLMSVRDCQSIVKKSVIEKIKRVTGRKVFPETGPSLPIQVTVHNDRVRILLNTSGESLSRRGYRTWNAAAPIRETLAAALVRLSGWQPGQPLHDPCCGSGTILTEAALMASGTAPGIHRHFAMELMKPFKGIPFEQLREEWACKQAVSGEPLQISGSDIDPEALELAQRHIRQAGFAANSICLSHVPLEQLTLEKPNGVFICNPPYGERLSDQTACRQLYHNLHELKNRHPGWKLCAISSDPAFERAYGKKADKKRRLYNGRLECVDYIYF